MKINRVTTLVAGLAIAGATIATALPAEARHCGNSFNSVRQDRQQRRQFRQNRQQNRWKMSQLRRQYPGFVNTNSYYSPTGYPLVYPYSNPGLVRNIFNTIF